MVAVRLIDGWIKMAKVGEVPRPSLVDYRLTLAPDHSGARACGLCRTLQVLVQYRY